MNILLWCLQGLLALHTAMGAVWKFSNSEQAVPSLAAIPHGVWLGMSVIEIVCSVALLLPAVYRASALAAPAAAGLIALEMLAFCALHLASGNTQHGQMAYWLVVAAISGFVALGRFVLRPL